MAERPLPSRDVLEKLYRYNPETGEFFHRTGRRADKRAMTTVHTRGYLYGHRDNHRYYAHRVAWKMVTGEDADCIDHIDHDPANNRFANLRSVSQSENLKNLSISKANKSGRTGVCWSNRYQKWVAQIGAGEVKYLGRYDAWEDAVAARQRAEAELGFHENHGRKD